MTRLLFTKKDRRGVLCLFGLIIALAALLAYRVIVPKKYELSELFERQAAIAEPASTAKEVVSKPKTRTHTVRRGQTLIGIAKSENLDWRELCVQNGLAGDCDYIKPGMELNLVITDETKARVKTIPARFFSTRYRYEFTDCSKTKLGYCVFSRPGGDKICGKNQGQILQRDFGLTKEEADGWLAAKKERKFIPAGTFIDGLSFGHGYWSGRVLVKQDMWYEEGVIGEKTFGQFDACCNFFPISQLPQPVTIEPEPVVEESQPEPEPVVEEPEDVLPVHAEEGDSIPCELQAGAGVYANRVYKGAWGYGEGICYVFKNGTWQHGPGFYAMAGGGESRMSTYSNKETGIGLQYGAQRNWINDRGRPSTFEVKARWLADRMWGSNSEGYRVNQKDQKFGLYSSYYERHGEDLVGVIGEYWKSFNSSVKSSWSGQKAQDRGSLSIYGIYEHPLGDSGDWRLRWIGGAQHTNWDKQNWLRVAAEFRYREWLMLGPQVALPIGISQPNHPLSHGDLTTYGSFIRFELKDQVREGDANHREGQLEFIPAGEGSFGGGGASTTVPDTTSQLEFVPTEAAKPPE